MVQILQQNSEFVAAESGNRVVGSHAEAKPVSNGHQQLVPFQVAKAVIHDLEAIQIEEEHREILFGTASRAHEQMIKPVDEKCPVRQPRQRIVEGIMNQLQFDLLAVRDVLKHADDERRLGTFPPN